MIEKYLYDLRRDTKNLFRTRFLGKDFCIFHLCTKARWGNLDLFDTHQHTNSVCTVDRKGIFLDHNYCDKPLRSKFDHNHNSLMICIYLRNIDSNHRKYILRDMLPREVSIL